MQKPRFLAFPSLLALGLVVAPACADDAVALEEGSASSEVSTSSEAEVGTDTNADDEAEAGADAEAEVDTGEASETTGMNMHPDPEGLEPVRGLQIAGITANQAITIAIANGTSWNDGNNRNASLVPGRRTLVRVWRTVDPGWVPREVHCRLELYLENGESRDYWSVLQNVSGDTQALDLSTSCNFLLNEEDAETSAGTTFQVSVWEPIGNGAGLTQHNTVSPADGPGLIGFEGFPMEMKMRMVKFEYQGQTPPIEQNLQAFHDALLEQDPLQRVILDVREEPAVLENPTLNAMTAILSQLRIIDGADWNQYYYGLVDTGQNSGTVGLAGLGGITGAGLWLNSVSATADTFVHEVGHNLNMSHVECQNGGMPPYANYPHAAGKIGVPGYGILSGQMYDPTVYYNYMTYCGPTWTSDWNFNQAWFRIYSATNDPPPIPKWPTIPGWPDDPMPHWVPGTEIPILRGMIGSDGFEDWWTAVDKVDPELLSGTQRFRFHQDGVLIAEVLGEVRVMPDDNSLWVSVPLTQSIDLDSVVITRESAGVVHEVPLRQEKQLHKIVLQRHGISAAPLPPTPAQPGKPSTP